jgi:hypothetical protein
MCSNTRKVLCGISDCITCYNRSFATHPKSVYWSSKNELAPHQILKSSNKKYLFNCEDCGHEIEMIVKNVSCDQWCKYCNRDGLCLDDDCEFCFNKSFASHPMASCWSLKNNITAREILKGSDKKFKFDCSECNHEFESALYSIKNNNHCPYCSNQKLCINNECKTCFMKSCASHNISNAWSPNNEIHPRMLFKQSNKSVIFNCLKCNHTYETKIQHYINRDGSCPFCANKKLCNNNCESCFNKSFASHPLVKCFSTKNNISSRNIFKGSEIKYIFDCNICGSEFESKMYNVLTGYWCPYCKNKTEAKLLEFLKQNYSNYKTQMRFDWCRYSNTNNIMPFDFGFADDNILIELDGEQHFTQVSNWNSPESVQIKDIEKIKSVYNNKYSLIHIYQKEVWNDIYDWKDILKKSICFLKKYKTQVVLFISCCNKYITHIQKLDSTINYKIVNPQNFEF